MATSFWFKVKLCDVIVWCNSVICIFLFATIRKTCMCIFIYVLKGSQDYWCRRKHHVCEKFLIYTPEMVLLKNKNTSEYKNHLSYLYIQALCIKDMKLNKRIYVAWIKILQIMWLLKKTNWMGFSNQEGNVWGCHEKIGVKSRGNIYDLLVLLVITYYC